MRSGLAALLATLLLPLDAAAGNIVRCVAKGGSVTYQEAPCPEASSEKSIGIPTDYPAPNFTERDRLLAREAALDKRLEARREREVQELAVREARAAVEAELEIARLAAAQQQPQYLLAYPYWRPQHPRPHPHRSPPRVWRTLAPR